MPEGLQRVPPQSLRKRWIAYLDANPRLRPVLKILGIGVSYPLFQLGLDHMGVKFPFPFAALLTLLGLSGMIYCGVQLLPWRRWIKVLVAVMAAGFLGASIWEQLVVKFGAWRHPQAQQSSQLKPESAKPSPARPTIAMSVYTGDRHKPGSKVYGIPWRADLMDVWVTISNDAGVDYENFSMTVEGMAMERLVKGVSLGFYEIAQASGLGECRTQRIGSIYGVSFAPREGEPFGRPIDGTNLETTVRNVRADCPRFAAGTILVFVVAVTNLREVESPKVKPGAALVGVRYRADGKEFSEPYFVDIRDMARADGRAKRTEEELRDLRSRILPGKASAVSETFSIK